MNTGEVFQELYLDAEHSSLPAGARLGGLVIMPGLMPVDPETAASRAAEHGPRAGGGRLHE
jgi:hypothetical protein